MQFLHQNHIVSKMKFPTNLKDEQVEFCPLYAEICVSITHSYYKELKINFILISIKRLWLIF